MVSNLAWEALNTNWSRSEMFRIGKVRIEKPVLLAPMAGITLSPFRQIAKGYGVGLVSSEMICANGIVFNNKNTYRLCYFSEMERPISMQIFGDIPENMVEAARFVDGDGADVIDINMGCPQAKIAKRGKGSGAALMHRSAVMEKVVGAVVSATNKPVTAKIRSGWSRVNAVEVAMRLEDLGVVGLAVHPRLGVQRFSGASDWNVIKQVKEAVDIPIVGSGDLFTPMDCKRMLDETGCDAVMLARGIRGSPWKVRNTLDVITGKEPSLDPTLQERLEILMELARGLLEYYTVTSDKYDLPDHDNPGKTMREIRKFVHWFFKGYPKWVLDRDGLLRLGSLEELEDFLEKAVERYQEYTLAKEKTKCLIS